jgi:hypothetical protein
MAGNMRIKPGTDLTQSVNQRKKPRLNHLGVNSAKSHLPNTLNAQFVRYSFTLYLYVGAATHIIHWLVYITKLIINRYAGIAMISDRGRGARGYSPEKRE